MQNNQHHSLNSFRWLMIHSSIPIGFVKGWNGAASGRIIFNRDF